MSATSTAPPVAATCHDRALFDATRPFGRDSAARSWRLLASTFAILLTVLTAAALLPWWPLRLAASLLGTLMLVRTFILYHDFLHGAILPRSRVARAIFYVYAAINLTPPRYWRDTHNFHHANVGKIEGSEVGAFPVMTTTMWRNASRLERFAYRGVRHPATIVFAYVTIFLFGLCLIPLVKRPRRYWDGAPSLAAHGGLIAALWYFGGFDNVFFALLLPMSIAGTLGGYLFYAQHAFPGMRILPPAEWNRDRAALVGSSFLRLSRLMHWFTGNIGYHHVHHVNSLIPFYSLPAAMAAIPELQHPVTTSLHPRDILACFRANLWDETNQCVVRYRDVER
jgi:omega-6 fatty acid desaturase (delta-12 desaturase)